MTRHLKLKFGPLHIEKGKRFEECLICNEPALHGVTVEVEEDRFKLHYCDECVKRMAHVKMR